MAIRSSTSEVTFQRPFRLPGMDAAAPAGTYKVEMEEEQLDTLTLDAWRQTAIVLHLANPGVTDHVTVDPQVWRDALLRDGDEAAQTITRPAHLGMRRR